MTLDANWAARWLIAAGDVFETERGALSELDRQIGDGDHGENLSRGFGAVRGQLRVGTLPGTPAEVLREAALTLISTVGGASGPLYGTALLRASEVIADKDALDAADVAALLRAGAAGIAQRGSAEPGDKTMLDSWLPAADAAAVAAERGEDAPAVLAAAVRAADAGAVATDDLIALRGRAAYLGERSRGHRDPGAASSALLIAAAADSL
ncbi:dihydroxyacetone kinase subunit L [Mycetocola tolaasinivorans]|uniref:Dihydroxyacetone kinase subunit L n=1 Tax=Mycetocola tolaasinivorans TaxID=76635 RepID=A0A3L7ADQ3_9MICO|nr:dihydroxyacetone kinase subunit DhaL [Mycetocola tolaasinivorans]RLP78094.1 dihydroxyacetone kinase subunit L [Mycetocola tolaasinivorans]